MIECIVTLDYEVFGNGVGSLKDLVYDPTERLAKIFKSWNTRFVVFVEVAEFEKIEAHGTDPAIDLVKRQIRDLHREGFEIGLHLHPQWCNANYHKGRWILDATEYNLCTLSRTRIVQIIQRSLDYMRYVIHRSDFTPLSFRAGNWLFQPTRTAASVLAENGIKVDSSVFKGGVQHNHGLDYRPAGRNGYFWRFKSDVNKPDPTGPWIEVPIYTEMVPLWRMPTCKRMSSGNSFGLIHQSPRQKLDRVLDFLRCRYPMKLDFCRMTLNEMVSMMKRIMRDDEEDPGCYRPVVAIGHTKDACDLETVDAFLSFLRLNDISVTTFDLSYHVLLRELGPASVCPL